MKRFELHSHSSCSWHKIWGIDGINSPKELVEMALQIGLDGIAITDHNTIKGSQKAFQYVKEKNLPITIIIGAEVRSKSGDILALGINKDIRKGLPILETIDAIKEQGGIAVAAHPYKYNTKIAPHLKDPSVCSRFDAIEVFNADVDRAHNLRASRLAQKTKMPGIAGSDAHYKMNLGHGVTCLDIENTVIDDVLSAIQKNKIELECNYPPLRNMLHLYTRKAANLLKRLIGKGKKTCQP